MSRIDVNKLYTLDDLLEWWKEGGWKKLADAARRIGPPCENDFAKSYYCETYRVNEGFSEVWYDWRDSARLGRFFGVAEMLELAATPPGKAWLGRRSREYTPRDKDHGGTPEEDAQLKELLAKILTAIIEGETIGEALSKISRAQTLQGFLQGLSLNEELPLREVVSSLKMQQDWRDTLSWLLHGLQSREACDEAYWNCIWLYAQSTITLLSEAKKLIDSNIPVSDELLDEIDDLLAWGTPTAGFEEDRAGKLSYRIGLEPSVPALQGGLGATATILCVEPAFALAQSLQQKTTIPRFVATCRAPSCGKRFYTGHANATNCPGSEAGKKNKCALEWNRYRHYLRDKKGLDPEEHWHDEELRKDFIDYDKG